ncbi:MAG: hypothetical protein ABI877_03975 [Gemmatimonadaceae bacterium]
MEAMWPVIYRIDSTDQLTYLNAAWSAFADANEGGALHSDQVIGRSLWDFLTDRTTEQLYRDMVQRVRRDGLPIRFRFRCDAPGRKRLLAMEIGKDDLDGVQFVVNSILEEKRRSVLPPARIANPSNIFLTICGWCKRVPLASGEWVEIEEAIDEKGLFDAGTEPRLTHGMCPMCYEAVVRMLDDPLVSASGAVTLGEIHAP